MRSSDEIPTCVGMTEDPQGRVIAKIAGDVKTLKWMAALDLALAAILFVRVFG